MNFIFDYSNENIPQINEECVFVTKYQGALKLLFNFPGNRFQNFNVKKKDFMAKLNATENNENIYVPYINSYRIICTFYEVFC